MAATELEVFSNGADYAVLYPPGEVEWSGTINSVMLNGNEWSLFSLEQDAIEVEGEAPPSIILWNLSPETEYTLQLVGGIFNQPLYEATFTTLASNFQTVANVGATSPSVGVVFVSFDLVGEGIVPSTIVEVGNTGLQPTNLGNGAYGITFTNVAAGTDEVAVYVPTYYVNVYNGETLTYSRGENWVPAATTDYYASVTVLTNTPPTPVDPSSSSAGTSGVLQFFNVFGQNPWQMVNALAEIGKSVPFTNPWSSGLGSNYTQWDATCSVAVVPQPGVIYAQSIEEASAGSTYAKFKYEDTDTPIPYNNALAVEGDSGQAYRMYAVHFMVYLGGGSSGLVFDPLANIVQTSTTSDHFWGFAVYDHTNNALVELISYNDCIAASVSAGAAGASGWFNTGATGIENDFSGFVRNVVRTYMVPVPEADDTGNYEFDVSVAIINYNEYNALNNAYQSATNGGTLTVAFASVAGDEDGDTSAGRLSGRINQSTVWSGTEPVTVNGIYTVNLFPQSGTSLTYPFPYEWYTGKTWGLPFVKAYRFNNPLLQILHVASTSLETFTDVVGASAMTTLTALYDGITGGQLIDASGPSSGTMEGVTSVMNLYPPFAWVNHNIAAHSQPSGALGVFVQLFYDLRSFFGRLLGILQRLFSAIRNGITIAFGDFKSLLSNPAFDNVIEEFSSIAEDFAV